MKLHLSQARGKQKMDEETLTDAVVYEYKMI